MLNNDENLSEHFFYCLDFFLFQQTWAGQEIVFEKEEVANMKKIEKPGIMVLGFKSRMQAIKLHYHVRPAQFLYPDENTVKGKARKYYTL